MGVSIRGGVSYFEKAISDLRHSNWSKQAMKQLNVSG